MKIMLAILACIYGVGFILIDKKYEAGLLCAVLAVLLGIWHSIDRMVRLISQEKRRIE